MTPEILAALDAAKRDKRPVVLATRLPDGEQRLLPDPVRARRAERRRRARPAIDDESGTRQGRRHRLVPARSTTRRCA